MIYLLALSSLATEGLVGCGFGRIKDTGTAANAAVTWDPSSIIASIDSQEQGLRWGANLGPHNVRRALNDLPAGGNRNNRFPGHEAGQELEPGLVLGLHLEHTLLP